jgi:hypothetical protein
MVTYITSGGEESSKIEDKGRINRRNTGGLIITGDRHVVCPSLELCKWLVF